MSPKKKLTETITFEEEVKESTKDNGNKTVALVRKVKAQSIQKKPETWVNFMNHATHGIDAERNNYPSMTVPDQSMPIQEVVRRFASGLPLSGSRVPGYIDDEESFDALPDLKKMDLAEIQQLKEQNDQELQRIRTEMVTKEKQLRDLKEKNRIDQLVNDEITKRERDKQTKEDFEARKKASD